MIGHQMFLNQHKKNNRNVVDAAGLVYFHKIYLNNFSPFFPFVVYAKKIKLVGESKGFNFEFVFFRCTLFSGKKMARQFDE